jgi:dGTPase
VIESLAPYASVPQRGRGRRVHEPDDGARNAYQRDRDRVIHSSAFRRLVYKTQVFINHEGDLFRTRLTHSLEVAQLARSAARRLHLHEDLVEAIALAHDLGHTPFGHAGQDALNAAWRTLGPQTVELDLQGFEHNLQSLRVVDKLELRYAAFDGLNLCFETREGILKHCAARHARVLEAHEPGGVGARFLHGGQPSLEAQLCNLADEIAYCTHDIDDGLRSALLDTEVLWPLELWQRACRQAEVALRGAHTRRELYMVLRSLLSLLVHDLVAHTQAQLQQHAPANTQAVRAGPALVGFSLPVAQGLQQLKSVLMQHLYRHPQVSHSMTQGQQVVQALFDAYLHGALPMPEGQPVTPRGVTDYIAGMTDRFALREHERLTGQRIFDA